jgi:hypothetical protein
MVSPQKPRLSKAQLAAAADKAPAKKPGRTSSQASGTPLEKPRRWRQGPVNIGNLTGRLTRPALGKRGFAGGEILSHWPTIVGAELAAFACPLEVKYPRGRNAGATLNLRVSHGAAAAMLQMKIPAIIERINRFFGYEAVVQVQAAQGPMPSRTRPVAPAAPLAPAAAAQVEREVDVVTSEPLKAALTKLGKSLQQRGR